MNKILIVDDSRTQRNWIKASIGEDGYDIKEAGNGSEALTLVEDEQFDLILCDLNMPVMSGVDLMETMKARDISVPVIIITADIQDSTKKKCMDLSVKAFVNKPLKDDRLKNAVEEVLKVA
ncbi:MAG: response regulator [Verrucomicrobiota bacterium]